VATYFRDFSDGGISDWTADRYASAVSWTVTGAILDGGTTSSVEAITWDDIDADSNRANVELFGEFRTDNASSVNRVLCIARGNTNSGATGSVYYAMVLRNTTLRATYKPDGGSITTITDPSSGLTVAANTWYSYRFRVITDGSTNRIYGKVWASSGSEPDWIIDGASVTDSNIMDAGVVGVQRSTTTHFHEWRKFGVGTNGDTAPSEAGGATTYTHTASLSAAIQQARSATASADAAIQTAGSATASADAAIVAAMSLEASLDAYIQALAERYARPDADVSDGDWLPSTPGDLYAMLDEETASDTDYIYTETASTCVIRLSDVADPGTSDHHVLRYRVRSAEGSTLVATLKQGATTIATRTHSALGTDWTTLEMNLSGTETDAITDYTDLTVTFAASDGVTWTPLELFAADEVGVWYDPSDFDTMWKDTSGTTPVTAVDDLVARIDDKSGNGFHATQATEAHRPVLKQDSNGNYYLLFDGTNDRMTTASIDFTVTDKMTTLLGTSLTSGTISSYAYAFVLGDGNIGTVAGGMCGFFDTGRALIAARATGSTAYRGKQATTGPSAGVPQLVTGVIDLAGTSWNSGIPVAKNQTNVAVTFNANGVETQSGTFGNLPIILGKNHSVWFGGSLYSLIIRGVTSTTDEIDSAEAYVNGKTEAY
jgi:hypothetical protein